jgi:hypothetical protein
MRKSLIFQIRNFNYFENLQCAIRITRVGRSVKKISKQAARERVVGSLLASLRIEKLTPSDTVVQGMRACMAGEETTRNLLAGIAQQHVALRRGR